MSPSVSGDAALQDDILESLSGAVRYRRWICELALPWLGDEPIEIGSGLGDYAAEWAMQGVRVTATEATGTRVAALQGRFAGTSDVAVRQLALPSRTDDRTYSAAVAINVLEHIDDDVSALESMRQLVTAGGHVVLFVPAVPFAMSQFDRDVGHFRRYRRAELANKLDAAGLAIDQLHYVNAPGLLAWVTLMRLGRGRPRDGAAVRTFDRIVPVLSRLEARRRPPFGQSLFASAEVP